MSFLTGFTGTVGTSQTATLIPGAYARTLFTNSHPYEQVFGGTFTVSGTTVLTRIWVYNSGGVVGKDVWKNSAFYLWDGDGTQLVSAALQRDPTTNYHNTGIFPGKVQLKPGVTYTFGLWMPRDTKFFTSSGGGPPLAEAPIASTSGNFTWVSAAYSAADAADPIDPVTLRQMAVVDPPDPTDANSWYPQMLCESVIQSTVVEDIPPDPITAAGGQQFAVAIQRNWFPNSVSEWTLQYSQSDDGASAWSSWRDLGTFSIADNVYAHTRLDPFDKPFYRYRYKVATSSQQSDWSEIAFTGKVVNAVVANDDGTLDIDSLVPSASIGSGLLNVDQLSAITANLGTVTAGVVRGPLIETSATNPRVYMQQDVGLQATDAGGGNVFGLDATTGALTLKGAIATGSTITGTTVTGGTIQTGTSGSRLVMDTSGLVAYKTDGTTKTLEFKTSDGSLAITGALTTGTGSVLDGSFISANTITASKLNVSTLSAITANLGTITAGAISGTTITGGTVQTATSNSRVVMTSAGIVGYASDGTTERFKLDTSTGLLTVNGQLTPTTGSVIDGQYITASTITTAKLSATAIDGMTVTGATLRTASSGNRMEMNSANLTGYSTGSTKTFDLSGAGGVKFYAATGSSAAHTINWWNSSETFNTASLQSWLETFDSDLDGIDDSDRYFVQLAATGNSGSGSSRGSYVSISSRGGTSGNRNVALLELIGGEGGKTDIPADAGVRLIVNSGEAGGTFSSVTLLDGEGNVPWSTDPYEFIQNPSDGVFRAVKSSSTVTVSWTSTSNFSADTTVTHGLGFTPTHVIGIMPTDPGAGNVVTFHTHSYTSTTFKIRAKYDPTVISSGSHVDAAWIAFG